CLFDFSTLPSCGAPANMRGEGDMHGITSHRWSFLLIIVALATSSPVVAAADPALERMVEELGEAPERNDAAAMAKFYFVQDGKDDRLAPANAGGIVSAQLLQNALAAHVSKDYGKPLVEQFGLIDPQLDLPMAALVHDDGDTAVARASGPDAESVWFKKIN